MHDFRHRLFSLWIRNGEPLFSFRAGAPLSVEMDQSPIVARIHKSLGVWRNIHDDIVDFAAKALVDGAETGRSLLRRSLGRARFIQVHLEFHGPRFAICGFDSRKAKEGLFQLPVPMGSVAPQATPEDVAIPRRNMMPLRGKCRGVDKRKRIQHHKRWMRFRLSAPYILLVPKIFIFPIHINTRIHRDNGSYQRHDIRRCARHGILRRADRR
uniref:Uncharacterized protein n=1 Tax=Candidatus Kentrum sp. SD TaxID=2126332 RepID=A0A450YT70_9GAMM|nr:MAG: hypothetical protein BECKSD772E_GA0070983_104311 [Candidatus Kentron sp. SD]